MRVYACMHARKRTRNRTHSTRMRIARMQHILSEHVQVGHPRQLRCAHRHRQPIHIGTCTQTHAHARARRTFSTRHARTRRLGIYTSSTVRTVAAAKQMLEEAAGCPLFEPRLVLYREHTLPAPALHCEVRAAAV